MSIGIARMNGKSGVLGRRSILTTLARKEPKACLFILGKNYSTSESRSMPMAARNGGEMSPDTRDSIEYQTGVELNQ